jgi:hypothetical protein
LRQIIAASFRWPGGKSLLSSEILKHVPKTGRKFVEPFAGRANLFFRAVAEGLKYQQWVLNDPLTAPFLRAVRDVGNKVAVPPRTCEEYSRKKALAHIGDQNALCLEPWLVFNGGTYDTAGWSSGGGRRSPEAYGESLQIACKALRDANPRITELDWLDCLQAEQLGPDDFVFVDGPYIDCEVAPYKPQSIVPAELIEYLRSAPFNWILAENKQPIYTATLGDPFFSREVQNRATNFVKSKSWQPKTECLWTNIGNSSKVPNRCTATVHAGADKDYKNLSTDELLKEIGETVRAIEAKQVTTSAEIRRRLMPALIVLRARLKRKKPGYYETLEKMGLNPSRVRSWFYRGRHAEEAIQMLEKRSERRASKQNQNSLEHELTDEKDALLRHADKMAAAVLRGKVDFARRLASEYANVRRLTVSV